MNIQERLNIYKKALKDYNYSLKKETKWYGFIYVFNKHTHCGFCHYFLQMHKLDVYEKTYKENSDRFNLLLPELYSTKPENANTQTHWFSSGRLEPRIECLEKAIKLCENENN